MRDACSEQLHFTSHASDITGSKHRLQSLLFSFISSVSLPLHYQGIIGLHHYSYFIGDNEIKEEKTLNFIHVVVSIDAKKIVSDILDFAVSVGIKLE